MYKAIIFDMDGTLMDSEALANVSLAEVLAAYGKTATPEEMKRSFCSTALETMEFMGLGDKAQEAARYWVEVITDRVGELQLFPGARELLAEPFRRSIVTSELREELGKHLGRLGIDDRFEHMVCADDTPYRKPHPHPLEHCLRLMGLATGDVLFIGDSQYDYQCARAAGVDFGLAFWGSGTAQGFEDATFVFRSFDEILPLVEKS